VVNDKSFGIYFDELFSVGIENLGSWVKGFNQMDFLVVFWVLFVVFFNFANEKNKYKKNESIRMSNFNRGFESRNFHFTAIFALLFFQLTFYIKKLPK
jgi:hypothetical protein